jgi:hypothetical protein
LAVLGLLLLAALLFAVARSGPLAPIRVTVAKVECEIKGGSFDWKITEIG